MMLDFTPEIARLSAREFMFILKERYQIQALVVGYDHRFGHNRSEGFEDYVHYGRELGMEVLLARAYAYSKEASVTEVTVSSSAIRGLLLEETFRKLPSIWDMISFGRYGCRRLSGGA